MYCICCMVNRKDVPNGIEWKHLSTYSSFPSDFLSFVFFPSNIEHTLNMYFIAFFALRIISPINELCFIHLTKFPITFQSLITLTNHIDINAYCSGGS